jgi:hypothetical protein
VVAFALPMAERLLARLAFVNVLLLLSLFICMFFFVFS